MAKQGDSFGGGWQERRAPRDGIGWRRRQPGAAESLVAPEGSASAGADEAQLQRGLVEENVGVVGHRGLPDTTFALAGNTSKSKVIMNQPLTIK